MNSINPHFQTGYKTPHENKHDEKADDARTPAFSVVAVKLDFATNYGRPTMLGKAG